ncbi:MAG: hypothetical protein M1817_000482 [Caeruleum heppii]|nr:MAG: hypothetical protein M1817_000482 [Caeruleum heppii]
MPRYAILGATGQTGSELVKFLLPQESVQLNIYARSASRIDSVIPETRPAKNARIYTGDLSDVSLLTACLQDVDVIFSAVAQNANEPTVDVAQRSAHSIVSALERVRNRSPDSRWTCPTLIFLSSASLNPILGEDTPRFIRWILHQALFHVYEDLSIATTYLRSHSWIPLVLPQPGGLVNDEARGVRISEKELTPLISYADLARGMVRMGQEEAAHAGTWAGKEVGLSSLGWKDLRSESMVDQVFRIVLPGLLCTWFPSVWQLGRSWRYW